MKRTAKKPAPPRQAPDKFFLNQVTRRINRKLRPVIEAISSYQASIQNGVALLQTMQETQEKQERQEKQDKQDKQENQEKRKVRYKQLALLLVVPESSGPLGCNEALLEDGFRHLVKEVHTVRRAQGLAEPIRQYAPDLILFMDDGTDIAEDDAAALHQYAGCTAVWLSDRQGSSESQRRLAPMFDCVFTQSAALIPIYHRAQGPSYAHLPFGADTSIYYPRHVPERYASDVLLIGDANSNGLLASFARSGALANLRVRVFGEGWERFDGWLRVPSADALADYANGAKLVVNGSASAQRVLEIAACGTFQLVQAHAELAPLTDAGDHLTIFRSEAELAEQLEHFLAHADARRLAATRALLYQKYHCSYLQNAVRLLDAIFA